MEYPASDSPGMSQQIGDLMFIITMIVIGLVILGCGKIIDLFSRSKYPAVINKIAEPVITWFYVHRFLLGGLLVSGLFFATSIRLNQPGMAAFGGIILLCIVVWKIFIRNPRRK